MPFTSGFDIEFQKPTSLHTLLRTLWQVGWVHHHNGEIQYLPVLCSGNQDWDWAPTSSWLRVLQDLETRESNREENALFLYWEKTDIGCAFRFFPNGDITVDFGSERMMLANCEQFTDVGWYITRIVCPLLQIGCRVDALRYSEVQVAGLSHTGELVSSR